MLARTDDELASGLNASVAAYLARHRLMPEALATPSALIATTHCCDSKQSTRNATARTCWSRCQANPACHFFSYSHVWRVCSLCYYCSLRHCKQGPGTCFDEQFVSYSRLPAEHYHSHAASRATLLLSEALQDNYSMAVYGAAGRVPVADLRLLWADLLPPRALAIVMRVGVCKADSRPPSRPFYWGQDVISNPANSVWVHRDLPDAAVANHSWAEVTHCPKPLANHLPHIGHGAEWVLGPFWAYQAPGSGTWINVGRSFVTSSYRAARVLLKGIFPAGSNQSCRGGLRARHVPSDHPLAGFDTLQLLGHKEYFSRELRHEIVVLRAGECDALGALEGGASEGGGSERAALAGGVAGGRSPLHSRGEGVAPIAVCGAPPDRARPCSQEWLRRAGQCRRLGSNMFSSATLQKRLAGPRCPPTPCYTDADVGRHYCPDDGQGGSIYGV